MRKKREKFTFSIIRKYSNISRHPRFSSNLMYLLKSEAAGDNFFISNKDIRNFNNIIQQNLKKYEKTGKEKIGEIIHKTFQNYNEKIENKISLQNLEIKNVSEYVFNNPIGWSYSFERINKEIKKRIEINHQKQAERRLSLNPVNIKKISKINMSYRRNESKDLRIYNEKKLGKEIKRIKKVVNGSRFYSPHYNVLKNPNILFALESNENTNQSLNYYADFANITHRSLVKKTANNQDVFNNYGNELQKVLNSQKIIQLSKREAKTKSIISNVVNNRLNDLRNIMISNHMEAFSSLEQNANENFFNFDLRRPRFLMNASYFKNDVFKRHQEGSKFYNNMLPMTTSFSRSSQSILKNERRLAVGKVENITNSLVEKNKMSNVLVKKIKKNIKNNNIDEILLNKNEKKIYLSQQQNELNNSSIIHKNETAQTEIIEKNILEKMTHSLSEEHHSHKTEVLNHVQQTFTKNIEKVVERIIERRSDIMNRNVMKNIEKQLVRQRDRQGVM